MLKTPLLRAIGIIAVSVLAGCASFPKEYVAKVDQMPDVSQYQNKPSVYIDLHANTEAQMMLDLDRKSVV